MYGAAIPSYDVGKEKSQSPDDLEWGGSLDYDNPDNFIDTNDRQRI